MKLPKNFGGQGFGNMMAQMQQAMAQAQTLETELANERFEIANGPATATFDGTGQLMKIKLDKSVVDPDDVEGLEDLIVGIVQRGFNQAVEVRNAKVQGLMPNLPEIPGITGR